MADIDGKSMKLRKSNSFENIVPITLFLIASISIITSIIIVIILIVDAGNFFMEVPFGEIFGDKIKPIGAEPKYGFMPIFAGTIVTSVIALLVAGPLGVASAMFMSEFLSPKKRKVIKPIIEVLAGIPSIVYGFFAFSTITPLLQKIIPDLDRLNGLSAGLVMGVMIIPIVTSISEDAMNAVPDSIRQGAYGLGSTKFEVAWKVINPAAISGIVAAFVLAISRAIGETMIVVLASGSARDLTFNPTESMQTMTSYIVGVITGDAALGTTKYYSLYAVGLLLFAFTLITNLIARYVTNKFRREY